MADGTKAVTAENLLDLALSTAVNAGIGAIIGKVSDVAGDLLAKAVGTAGRGSFTQVYKMADTKIHNGTWSFSSLRVKTWLKCIGSESVAGVPGIFLSVVESAVQRGAKWTQDNIEEKIENMIVSGDAEIMQIAVSSNDSEVEKMNEVQSQDDTKE